MSHPALDVIKATVIVPVVVIDDANNAQKLAHALLAGGIRVAEVTLRTPAGLRAIEEMNKVTGFTAGAGTVLNASQAEEALHRGANFLISPGFDEGTQEAAERHGSLYIPGVATATELQTVLNHDIDHVKLFPAGHLGGEGYLNALAGPFPQARFLPSGGVTLDNMRSYLATPNVYAVSGSWMVPRTAIAEGDFERISELAASSTQTLPARTTP